MNLRDYISSHPRSERRQVRESLAHACGVTEPCIRHYANNIRTIPSKHLLTLVSASGGKITLEGLLEGIAA
jgi:DNA-binding transcriptional regulator YdaS (Cro superfamily)